MREMFAQITGTSPDAFERDELTIVPRPEPPPWPFTALIVGFGTGVVACLEGRFVDWFRAHAPERYFHALYMLPLLEREARQRGEAINPNPPTIGWALARVPGEPTAPPGYRLERVDQAWMRGWQKRGVFHNALGTPEQEHRTYRNRDAFVLSDEAGAPAAIAGVYDTAGLLEIGVDVTPGHRGRGLAPVVVRAAARAIVRAGGVAFYQCPATNVRSQRTALASGFVPACSLAVAYQAGLGIAGSGLSG